MVIFKISLICYIFIRMGDPGMIFALYQRLIGRLPDILYKPLGGCLYCFTGQVCFWYFLIANIHSYNFIEHMFFTSAGISLSLIYNKIWTLCES